MNKQEIIDQLAAELNRHIGKTVGSLMRDMHPRNRKQRALAYIRRKNQWRAAHASVSPYPLTWKRDKTTNDQSFIITYSLTPVFSRLSNEAMNKAFYDILDLVCKGCGRPITDICYNCDVPQVGI